MKKLLIIAGLAAALSCSIISNAQEEKKTVPEKIEHGTKKAVDKTAKGVKKVGTETKEVAAKGAAKIVDKTYADKVGPEGQTLYIDKHSKYYYIDENGHKMYVTKAQMKDK